MTRRAIVVFCCLVCVSIAISWWILIGRQLAKGPRFGQSAEFLQFSSRYGLRLVDTYELHDEVPSRHPTLAPKTVVHVYTTSRDPSTVMADLVKIDALTKMNVRVERGNTESIFYFPVGSRTQQLRVSANGSGCRLVLVEE